MNDFEQAVESEQADWRRKVIHRVLNPNLGTVSYRLGCGHEFTMQIGCGHPIIDVLDVYADDFDCPACLKN